ncbi:putative ORFan [Tupanvirus deep ocean]|uniref:ORFan n=2 Tax=Tupanvirus TaxID=2094720 RepID=A0AC62A944_9VIRU|nr:putative ORFan [Tupanvirus deep ocean]QKU34170.1 putative ORFan [Tupanvirus deep ocean]
MIIKDTVFDTYRICESSHIIYDIDNTIHNNSELSVKVANNDNHILIELSLNCYKSIEYIHVGNKEINPDYYKCCISVGENSNKLIVSGIIISKYDFNYDDNTVVVTFKKKRRYNDKNLKIYCLDSHTTYFSVLSLLDNTLENNKIYKKHGKQKSDNLISEMDKLNYLNESVSKEIKNLSRITKKKCSTTCTDSDDMYTISSDSNESEFFCTESENSEDDKHYNENHNIKNKININSDTYKPILIINNNPSIKNTNEYDSSSDETKIIIKLKETKKNPHKIVKRNIPIDIDEIDDDFKKKHIEKLKREAMRQISETSVKKVKKEKKEKKYYDEISGKKKIKIIKEKKNINHNVKMDELETYNTIYKNRYQTKNIDHELNCLQKDIHKKYLEIKEKLISQEINSVTPFVEYINNMIVNFRNNYGDILGPSLLTIMSYLVI